MTALVWDQVGEREFQTGVDHGVLYISDDTAVVWNGLTEIEESPTGELRSYYIDGLKYLEYLSPGDFSGRLTAYTYPEEFDSVTGVLELVDGLYSHDQPSKSFSLSYRTKLGNDLEGLDHGYKIHILYNLLANPDSKVFSTLHESVEPTEFAWALSAKPVVVSGSRHTAHISLDSTKIDSELLQTIEEMLYGSDSGDPELPSIDDIIGIIAIPPEE